MYIESYPRKDQSQQTRTALRVGRSSLDSESDSDVSSLTWHTRKLPDDSDLPEWSYGAFSLSVQSQVAGRGITGICQESSSFLRSADGTG